MSDKSQQEYFRWLYSHFGVVSDKNPSHTYWILSEQLFNTPFIYYVPNDENRAADGIDLRNTFMDDSGWQLTRIFLNSECSILEMLIALADRAAFSGGDLGIAEGIGEWFHIFLRHLGLTEYTDDLYSNDITASRNVDQIIDGFNRRTYSFEGIGGLFPLRNAQNDQATVELWYQLETYILENAQF